MEHINITNDNIKHIHKLVYDELKTKYKINKFVNECKKLNDCHAFGDLNQKINELIKYYDTYKNIKFNRTLDDFYISDIEYSIFYYFKDNDYNYNYFLL
jgi:hypothetical protein